jgi:hypothetical protein
MTWTYGGDPTTSDLDAVRLLLGDTDPDDPRLTDEEIGYFLARANVPRAAALACRAMLAGYRRAIRKAAGPLSLELQQQFSQCQELCRELEAQASRARLGVAPLVTDRGSYRPSDPRPVFTRHLHEYIRDDDDRLEASG